MLPNLLIKNFRMLADFKVEKLGAVNLIIGKNNCGKSSLLEALLIYATRGNPRVLMEIAASHDESAAIILGSDDDSSQNEPLPFIDFFYGRQFPAQEEIGEIYIGDRDEKSFVAIDHIWIKTTEEMLESSPTVKRSVVNVKQILKQDLTTEDMLAEQALKVTINESRHRGLIPLIETQDYATYQENTNFWRRIAKETPYSFVPTQFVSMDDLAKLWDRITATPEEAQMNAALKIIDDNFQQLSFVKPRVNPNRIGPKFDLEHLRVRPRSDRIAVVKLKTSSRRLPLSSMGDGMLRTLQLVLALFRAKNGILLIDEFENGLHWHVQEKIWQMIFKLAREMNIQVFATTHSDDTIKAFSSVAQVSGNDGILLKLVRRPEPDGRDKIIAVTFESETLNTAVLTETEIR